MGYTPYKIMVLLPQGHRLTFADLIKKLRNKFSRNPKIAVDVNGTQALIRHGEWFLTVAWEDEPHVAIESQEIADGLARNNADHDVIVACSRRITTWGQPDPNMDYFNDYVFVLEVLESISGVFVYSEDEGLRKIE
jgi:hypothetical protein